tara:strand:- start:2 stop:478 length:477 start_codon:yes stop_codon:yes gene_type:complete
LFHIQKILYKMSDKKVLINNKKANFNYQFSDKYIAGLVLRGTEIKSIKDSSVNFSNSYCIIDNDEIYLKGMVINEYKYGNINNHQKDRDRKLLLNKKEIHQIKKKVTEKKFSLIPIKLFINQRGFAKIEIGLGKGKKEYDKREDIKQRDISRKIREDL